MSMKMSMADFIEAKARHAHAVMDKLRRDGNNIGTRLSAASKEHGKLRQALLSATGGNITRRKVAIRLVEVENEIKALKLEAGCIQDQIALQGEHVRYLDRCKKAWLASN